MQLFQKIPDRFFSILTSPNKELYVQALFVLRQAFKTELVIRREELAAMLIDSLDASIEAADFSQELQEDGAGSRPEVQSSRREREAAGTAGFVPGNRAASRPDPPESLPEASGSLSEKAHFLLRRLKDTGWIESEYEARSFDEHITIPDYAVAVVNLLYDLSTEKVREYNSYVYATYAALANAQEVPEYTFSALQAAYQNTVSLIDELKTLFNNIRRYYRLIPGERDVNELLREHFDEYKAKIIDAVYYPLKTMDSVPRFKHPILTILNAWNADDAILNLLLTQGLSRRMFEGEQQGREQIGRMINYIADTYEGIEEMLDEIDRKHNEYTNASIDHIRYLMNSDRGVKGKLIELMKHAHSDAVMEAMQQSIRAGQYLYVDMKSLYTQAKRSVREEGKPLAVSEKKEDPALVAGFLEEVRRRYTNPKIDAYVEACFGGREMFLTEEAKMEDSEDFILFLLGTLRGQEKSAGYTVEFLEGNREVNGCSLPGAVFRRKP